MALMNQQIFKDARGGLMPVLFFFYGGKLRSHNLEFSFVDTDGKTDMSDPGKSLLTRCVSTETLNVFEKVLHCFLTLQ